MRLLLLDESNVVGSDCIPDKRVRVAERLLLSFVLYEFGLVNLFTGLIGVVACLVELGVIIGHGVLRCRWFFYGSRFYQIRIGCSGSDKRNPGIPVGRLCQDDLLSSGTHRE